MRRVRGVALITAILITALAASVAAALAWENALDVRRTMVLLNRDQAVQVALGAENWIANILVDDLNDSPTDHLDEIWAQELPGLPIDGGDVWGKIEDMQGRFNVNNLIDDAGEIDEDTLEQFRRLLAALQIDPRFAGLTADWIDADLDASFPDGAEDSIYTAFSPPYRAPNRRISSVSELMALEGMDKATFDILAPHIVALPQRTTINVNTATPAVLQSLDETYTASDVERIMGERENGGFVDLETTFEAIQGKPIYGWLDETTDYFQLLVVVRIDNVRITYYSLLQRGPGSAAPILRSFGTT
ncbi:MAG: type II secretion system minor pseudopilin GspK [Woeseiaceae bacterium]